MPSLLSVTYYIGVVDFSPPVAKRLKRGEKSRQSNIIVELLPKPMTEGRHIWVRWTTFKKTLAELGTFKSMAMAQQGFETMNPNQRCPIYHECRTCEKTFTTARGLSIHVSKVHKVYDMFGGVPSHAESKLDHEAVPAKYFDDDECGPLADIIVSCLERDVTTSPVVTTSIETFSDSDVTTSYDYESDREHLTHDEAMSLLRIPSMISRGTQRYILFQQDVQNTAHALGTVCSKDQACVVFWQAAQQGCMSGKQAQKFVDVIHHHKADLVQLPATLRTIRKHVNRVAGRWCKRTANVMNIHVTELAWHRDVLFVYHDVVQLMADLLQDTDMCGADTAWEFKERRTRNGSYRVFGELNEGYWWERVGTQIPPGTFLCPLILNTDETVMRFGSRASQKPMYITVGNLSYTKRSKDNGKHMTTIVQRCDITVRQEGFRTFPQVVWLQEAT